MVVLNLAQQGVAGPEGAKGATGAEGAIPFVNAKNFGAVGNGVADDTAAIQAAIDSLSINGGTIILPGGIYNYTQLDLKERRCVLIRGVGGMSSGATQATLLNCIREDGVSSILLKGTSGFKFIDLAVVNLKEPYTGTLIDFGGIGGAYFEAERCHFTVRANALIYNLDKVIVSGFHRCNFGGGKNQIKGVSEVASFANAIGFDSCIFKECGEMPIINPGEAWEFSNCTWEPLTSGKEAAIECVLKAEGLGIIGCWFGDGNKTGTWISFNGYGLTVSGGCEIGTGAIGIQVSAESEGFAITGNKFESCSVAIKLLTNCENAFIGGNKFLNCTKNIEFEKLPRGIVQVVDGEINAMSFRDITFEGDNITRIFRSAAGIVQTVGAFRAEKGITAFQGKAEAITLAEAFIQAAGTNPVQNIFVDAKGEGGTVKVATRGLATGGALIAPAGGKVGFFGIGPVTRRVVKPPAEVTAKELCEALEALGLVE